MPNEVLVPQQIPIELIHDLPDLPRVSLPDKAYGGLVTSILLDGVKSPLILRQAENGELQLVAGYRRRKAAELAKLKELPALVYITAQSPVQRRLGGHHRQRRYDDLPRRQRAEHPQVYL